MKRNICLKFLLSGSLLTSTALFAADAAISTNAPPGTNAATLESLVLEVLEHNPELNFYRAEIAATKGGRRQAGTYPNPELSGSGGQKRVNGGGLSGEGMAWSVSVVQPFEWPGRIGLRKAIANREVELAEVGYERFRVALATRVSLLAYNIFAAQEKSAVAREVADRFNALREVLVQRDPAGLTPLLETRIIEATELTMQRKATEGALAIQLALLELNQLRGQPADTQFTVQPAEFAFRPPEDLGTVLALARTNNFELRLRAVELAQQGFRVALAKNERYPALSIGPSFSQEKVGAETERVIGVGISFPLPLWNRNQGNIDTARARQLQAEASYAVVQRDVERQVVSAASTYQVKLREMSRWRADSVQHFREAAEVSDRHYRLGAVPIATYVELQEKYLEAVEGLLDTKREALEAAQNIQLLTGLAEPLATTTRAGEKPQAEEKK